MKSPGPFPPPPPPPPGSALAVEPVPVGPSAEDELEELDELPDDEPEPDPPDGGALPRKEPPPSRLVADWNAEDAPGAALEAPPPGDDDALLDWLADDEADELFDEEEDADAELSRWPSERLPRNCGVTSDTNFSAAVTPVIRMVDEIGPAVTLAVRIPESAAAGALREGALRCQYTRPAAAITARTSSIQTHDLRGFLGSG